MFVTLVAVIVALVLGHVAHAPVAALRQFQWFSHGLQWLGARAPEGAFWRQRHGIWLALLPPVLVLALLQFALWGRLLGLASLVLGVLVLAWALYAHLATVLPRRRIGLAWTVAAVVMLGVPAWLGAQWLNRMRLTNEMYMSSLFPPSLRVAPTAPVDQLLQDAEALRAKLDRRLKDDGLADEDE